MPLKNSDSKSAFSQNVKAEMDAGRPQKQAVAIAYSVQHRARSGKFGLGSTHTQHSRSGR